MKCPKCHFENTQANRYCADCGTSLTPLSGSPSPSSPPAETQTLPPFFELETGTLFAERYQVIEKLGMGGMGRVYKVYDTKIKERIALKLLKPEIIFDNKTIERFRTEIRLARRIAHKNVCRMFDWGEFSRLFYITMEYVPGENLKNIIRMTGPLNAAKVVGYARQICEGLAEAHRWEVVHRDLKPHNIMIDPTGTVRIMDFGIARSVHTKGWTGEGIAVGTPEYMSPEQAEGQEVDKRTDIYSLGIILYEMITGKVPFEGETTLSILRKQELEPPVPPKEWNPQIPDRLNTLILKCLEKKPERRHQNAEELFQDLGTIKTASFPAPRIKSRTTRKTALSVRRFPIGPVLGISLAALILLVVGYFLLRPRHPELPEEKPMVVASYAEMPAKMPTKISVVVLPFDIKGLGQYQENLWSNLADDIRTGLNRIDTLNVIWKPSCESIKELIKSPEKNRKDLKDKKILGGVIMIENITVRVIVELTEVKDIDQGPLPIAWSHKYEYKLDESYFKVSDKLVNTIAQEFNRRFGRGTLEAIEKTETSNQQALIFFHRAQDAEIRYRDGRNLTDFKEAVDLYKKAIDLDPNYWRAFWGLGNVYESRYVQTKQAGDPSARENLAAMIKYFEEAYAKNNSAAVVYSGLGWAYFHQEDFGNAYASFRKAVELDPNSPDANFSAGSFLRSIGLDAQAIKYYQRAINHDPMNDQAYLSASLCSMYNGKYEEATSLMKQALAIKPDNFLTHIYFVRLLMTMKNFDDAEKELLWIEKNLPSSPPQMKRLKWAWGWLLATKGEKEKALAMIQDADQYRYEITSTYSLLGMKKEAIRYIKLGNEQGFKLIQDYMYPYPFLISNPYFDNLRDEPGFQEIVRKEKAKFEEKTKKYGGL